MAQFKTLQYVPPNLQEKKLYNSVTDLLDKSIDLAYTPEISKLKNLYNPASPFYDPQYILKILGADTLRNLLSDIVDETTLSMVISDIHNVKGTVRGFEAILKLLKLKYKDIVYTQQPNGCTEAILIFERGTRINIDDIVQLDRFAQEVFPLCLTLTGVTNCRDYSSGINYSGYDSLDLGQHRLDRNFTLSMSKLDRSYGVIDTAVSTSIALLICNSILADLTVVDPIFGIPISTFYTKAVSADMNYTRSLQTILDRNLTLDRFDNHTYNMFDPSYSRLFTHEVYCNLGFKFNHGRKVQNYPFTLDRDHLDSDGVDHPLDAYEKYVFNRGTLDSAFYLDRNTLDRTNPIVISAQDVKRHNTQATVSVDTGSQSSLRSVKSHHQLETRREIINRLDRNLTLDRFNGHVYYMFDVMASNYQNHELAQPKMKVDDSIKRQNAQSFCLSRNVLDRDDLAPIGGFSSVRLTYNSLDRGLMLSRSTLDTITEVTIKRPVITKRKSELGTVDPTIGMNPVTISVNDRVRSTDSVQYMSLGIASSTVTVTYTDNVHDVQLTYGTVRSETRTVQDSYDFREISNTQYLFTFGI